MESRNSTKPNFKKLTGGSTYGQTGEVLMNNGYITKNPIGESTEKIMNDLTNLVADMYVTKHYGLETDFAPVPQSGGNTTSPLNHSEGETAPYSEQNKKPLVGSASNENWIRPPQELKNAPFNPTVLLHGGSDEDRKEKQYIENNIPNKYIENAIEPYTTSYGENSNKSHQQVVKEVKSILSSIILLSQKACDELEEITKTQSNLSMYK